MKCLKPQARSINGIMLDGEQWMPVNELSYHRPLITEIIRSHDYNIIQQLKHYSIAIITLRIVPL
mgnify:CR=1 FL=1